MPIGIEFGKIKFVQQSNSIPVIYDVLYQKQSPYQKIRFGKYENKYFLFLDGKIQFVYPEEKIYHKGLIDKAVKLLGKKPERVLILGGGDGMAARDALKFKAKEIIVVEIDPEMIKLFKYFPLAAKLNNYVFWNNKVKIIIDDAYKVPYMKLGRFDIIAVDLTDPDKNSKHLYKIDFIKKLIKMLKKGGVLSGYAMKEISKISKIEPFICNIPYMGIGVIYYYKNRG